MLFLNYFLSSNIPAAPAYGVYIFQLIRYFRACISYHDFLDRGLMLTRKLLNQEFQMMKLKSSLRKFYGRHHDLVDHYEITVTQIYSLRRSYNLLPFLTGVTCGAGSAYPSGAPEITPSFCRGSCCLFFSFLCCVMCSIVCLFVFFHL